MSRIASAPITIPSGVDIKLAGNNMTVKGKNGQMSFEIKNGVTVEHSDNIISIQWDEAVKKSSAHAGTVRAVLNNMVIGVSKGFEKKLSLIGVGYRAQVSGKTLNLSLGFSHPIEYPMPEGITIEAASQTELVVKGMDKQKVGQVAAEIRAYRPPEPYKGKGVRYTDEHVVRKEAKKK
ncbi:MAG: 50S ribosomal protein L6 [Methylococcaceae bacterium]|nr:50S ribosomal protein L6 [Methylococcaceae bacterium]